MPSTRMLSLYSIQSLTRARKQATDLVIRPSIRTYLEETNVQLGASYNIGQKATQKYNEGLQAAADFINADVSEIGILPLNHTPTRQQRQN